MVMDKKLKKLKMPMAKAPEKDMMEELDYEGEDMEMPEDMEMADEEMPEMEEDMDMDPAGEMPELSSVSDELLMAELKKRGLGMDMEEEEEEV
jgi:hypothetical protein